MVNNNTLNQYNNFTKTLNCEIDSKDSTTIDSALISQHFREQSKFLKKLTLRSHSSTDIHEIIRKSKECSLSIINIISKVKNILSIGIQNPLIFINDELEKVEKLKK